VAGSRANDGTIAAAAKLVCGVGTASSGFQLRADGTLQGLMPTLPAMVGRFRDRQVEIPRLTQRTFRAPRAAGEVDMAARHTTKTQPRFGLGGKASAWVTTVNERPGNDGPAGPQCIAASRISTASIVRRRAAPPPSSTGQIACASGHAPNPPEIPDRR